MLYLTDVYQSIKEQLIIPFVDGINFGISSTADIDYDPIAEEIKENLTDQINRITNYKYSFSIHNGCTKLAIVFDELPYVIKIPFEGEYFDVPHGYDENDEELYTPTFNVYSSNYCAAEVELYNKTKTRGLEMFFAKTLFYGNTKIDNYPLYLQEKVYTSSEFDLPDIPCEASTDLYEYYYNITDKEPFVDDIDWTFQAVKHFGLEKLLQLTYYADKYEPSLNCDMHSENYGYRANGEPAILDFTGFYD